MPKGIKYSESKIIEILKKHKSGINALEICRKHQISKTTLHKWRRKYQNMTLSNMQKALEEENGKLKQVCANLSFPIVNFKT